MATINFRIYKKDSSDIKPIMSGKVVGRKMTSKWMKEHYGEGWDYWYESMYLCHKNEYGIKWIVRTRKFDTFAGVGNLPYGEFHFSII